jgi:hypothetical protein
VVKLATVSAALIRDYLEAEFFFVFNAVCGGNIPKKLDYLLVTHDRKIIALST